MACAARTGQLIILKWLQVQGCEWDNAEICVDAAESGDMSTLLYAREQGGVLNEYTMCSAAQAGQLHMCQYLRMQQCQWDASATNQSAYVGHAAVLSWLLQHSCPVDLDDFGLPFHAGLGSHIDVMQALQDPAVYRPLHS
jgi:hypothetical protein